MRVDEEELSNLGTLQPDKNKDDKLRESLIQGGWQYITYYHKIVVVDHIIDTITLVSQRYPCGCPVN